MDDDQLPMAEADDGATEGDDVGDPVDTYQLVVAASDGTGTTAQTGYQKVTVEVTNVDEDATTGIEMSSLQPQVSTAITVGYVDEVGNPFVAANGVANTGIEDPDNVGTITGELNSAAVDEVEWQWSKSSSRSGRYTDITGDDAAETKMYIPASQDRDMYLRVTATYEDGEGEGKTVVATSAYPVRAFPSGNSGPAFPDDFDAEMDDDQLPMAEADDGATEGDDVGDPVEANDANNDRLTYSLEGDDSNGGDAAHADLFQIDRMTGQVTVGLGQKVNPSSDTASEVPSLGKGDSFMVTIKATDPSGLSAMVVMTITVDEVDEAPVFTAGKTSHSHAENTDASTVVYPFVAYDPENDPLTYSLSGADDGKLSIAAGGLTFVASPNFEARGSADGDNVYEVTVKASSTSITAGATEKSTTVDVMVEVTNEDEPGTVSLSASQPRVGVEIRADMPVDPDGGVTGVTWQWSRADQAAFGDNDNVTKIKDATNAGYTPVADDDTKYLRVTASYTDVEGSGKTAVGTPNLAGTAEMVQKVRNLAPVFNDEDEDEDSPGIQVDDREVDENTVAVATDDGAADDLADNVGDSVVATDNDDAETGDNTTILYLLSGADASSFRVRSDTGQIEVGAGAKLDYETRDTYMVTVTARDPEGLNSSVDVTIKVTDVDEAPMIMVGGLAIAGPASVDYPENGTDAVATYRASGPDADMATWTLEGADAGQFSITNGMLMFMTAPDYENAADADMDNEYMVTVMADDGTYMDTHDVTVMVTDVEEVETVTLSAMRPQVETAITASLTDDGDEILGDVTWQWASSDATDGTYTNIEGATSAAYTPVGADANMYLRATAMYADAHGSGKTAKAESESMVVVGGLAISSGMASVEYAENGTDAVATYMASGPDASMATWSLEGADAGDFDISSGGELTFVSAPDYENPADADMDNTYMVTVNATDGTYMAMRAVAVMVTDVDEVETVTLSATQPQIGTEITAELIGGDAISGDVTWQWARAESLGATPTDIPGAMSAAYTPVVADGDMYLRATAMYADAHEADRSKSAVSENMVRGLAISGMMSVEDYAENGTDAVATYMASGPDADMATWSLEGDDAGAFAISASGELTFVSAPDYETAADADTDNEYMVTVTATGGTYTATPLDVVVTVTDVDETPSDPVALYDENKDGTIVAAEVLAAVSDYFSGDITASEVLAVVAKYFADARASS